MGDPVGAPHRRRGTPPIPARPDQLRRNNVPSRAARIGHYDNRWHIIVCISFRAAALSSTVHSHAVATAAVKNARCVPGPAAGASLRPTLRSRRLGRSEGPELRRVRPFVEGAQLRRRVLGIASTVAWVCERVGFDFPSGRLTVSPGPADLPNAATQNDPLRSRL
jgi:hypothetical protein